MKREIKYRGKSSSGVWYYGYYTVDAYGKSYIESLDSYQLYSNPVEIESVGEYTGLKDKNDKEIYEGDILEDDSGLWEVWYNQELASFVLDVVGKISLLSLGIPDEKRSYMFSEFYEGFEVIGNIYKNPELLNPNT